MVNIFISNCIYERKIVDFCKNVLQNFIFDYRVFFAYRFKFKVKIGDD